MRRILSRAGRASRLILTVLTIVLLTAVSITTMRSHAAVTDPATSASERARYLYLAGITPECMATSGISPDAVEQIVSSAVAVIEANATPLVTAESAVMTAERSLDVLRRKIRSGTATIDERNSLASVAAAAEAARSNWEAMLASIREAACDEMTGTQITSLTAVRANARWGVPFEYKRATRTEREWIAIRNALAAERIAVKEGTELDEAFETLLLQVRAEDAASESSAWIDTRLDSIRSQFQSALSG